MTTDFWELVLAGQIEDVGADAFDAASTIVGLREERDALRDAVTMLTRKLDRADKLVARVRRWSVADCHPDILTDMAEALADYETDR